MSDDTIIPMDIIDCSARMAGPSGDALRARGRFRTECLDKNGIVRWAEEYDNLVVNEGKNLMLDSALAGSGYTALAYMGLVSLVGYNDPGALGSAFAAGDTMASHSNWKEAGVANAPTYSGTRKTCVWAAAVGGVKALSPALSFAITGTGTVKGTFIVFGPGAVNTIDSAAGVLFAGGLFSSGDRAVISGDTINASYSITL